jgi:hypothetical protein
MGGVLIFPRGWHSKLHGQRAIVQRPGLNPNYLGKGCQQSMQYHEIKNKDKEALDNLRIPEMLGLSIEGDGETEGVNTFPYRFFSSEQISNLVIEGFESLNDRLEQNRIPDADQDEMEIFQPGGFNTIRIWNPELPPEGNFKAKSGALDLYLRINVARITAYPEWKEIGRHQWIHLILANILGLVVQWGTTGPAIWVMYWSPPVVSFPLGFQQAWILIRWTGSRMRLWRVTHIWRWCHFIVVVIDSWQPTLARLYASLSTLPPSTSQPVALGSPRTHSIPYFSLLCCRDYTHCRESNSSHQRLLDLRLVIFDLYQCHGNAILHHRLFLTWKSWLDAIVEL